MDKDLNLCSQSAARPVTRFSFSHLKYVRLTFLMMAWILSSPQAQPQKILWGTTLNGGSTGGGVLYSVNSNGSNFEVKKDIHLDVPGIGTMYSQLALYNGLLYGTTIFGGTYSSGVLYVLNPVSNAYTKLFDFPYQSAPQGSLSVYNNKLYGMASGGGVNNRGYIFEWDLASNTFSKKVDLSDINGTTPYGSLTLAGSKFYGMTSAGGNSNAGVLFSWDPSTNVYTKLVDLTSATGSNPYGSVTEFNGKLYGMTRTGGISNMGVIFEYDPTTNVYSKKIDFTGGNGRDPYGSLTVYNNKLYGMTRLGVSNGNIIEYEPVANILISKVALNFTIHGAGPFGDLTLYNNEFYGLAFTGGGAFGTLIRWNPSNNSINTVFVFSNPENGANPYGSLTVHNNKLFGHTRVGGKTSGGLIFAWNATNNQFERVVSFRDNSEGHSLHGPLTLFGTKFYGVAMGGGANGVGTIVEFDRQTNVFSKKYDFSKTSLHVPSFGLTLLNKKLFGVTTINGVYGSQGLYEWDPVTNIFSKKAEFTSATGTSPIGRPTAFNNKIYVVMRSGGANNAGSICEYNPTTGTFTKRVDLNTAIGASPNSALVPHNGRLYGVMSSGGLSNSGTIYEWNPTTNQLTKKADIGSLGVSRPTGELLFYKNNFYGITGGGNGVTPDALYQWNPSTNVLTKRTNFLAVNPAVSLSNANDGKLYGVDVINEAGTIYEYNVEANTLLPIHYFDHLNGASPNPITVTGFNDLSISLLPTTDIRPGFNAGYRIFYKNQGTEPIPAATIRFVKLDRLTFSASSVPHQSITGDTISWSFSNLLPGDTGSIQIILNVSPPPTVEIGDVAVLKAIITPVSNDITQNDNTAILTQTIVGSYDPNDKREVHGGKINLQEVQKQEWLTYIIRFQNTGTASAINIEVRDTLDTKLDWNSFEMLQASHTYEMEVVDGNKILWRFSNINLPDSNTNESGSHGFVSYRIKSNVELAAGDVIENVASIYFDFNPPIRTNIEHTLVDAVVLPMHLITFTGSLNKSVVDLQWKTADESNMRNFVVERSSNGTVFEKIGVKQATNLATTFNYLFTDYAPLPDINFYRLRIVDNNNKSTFSQTIAVHLRQNNSITIFPNPTKEQLNVQVANMKGVLDVKLIDSKGTTLIEKQISGGASGNLAFVLATDQLPQGIYLLTIQSGDKKQSAWVNKL